VTAPAPGGRAHPGDGAVVLHFSEDPALGRFEPHRARTSRDPRTLVWAVEQRRAPDYWFPRDCPRAMAWTTPGSTDDDALRILGPGGGERVHAVEHRWLRRIADAELYAYRLPATTFAPVDAGPDPHAVVSEVAVEALGPAEPVGDLLALHERAGIQLRVLPGLEEFWRDVVASSLGFSGIRLGNATPPVRS
jgi:hypothetical protein